MTKESKYKTRSYYIWSDGRDGIHTFFDGCTVHCFTALSRLASLCGISVRSRYFLAITLPRVSTRGLLLNRILLENIPNVVKDSLNMSYAFGLDSLPGDSLCTVPGFRGRTRGAVGTLYRFVQMA